MRTIHCSWLCWSSLVLWLYSNTIIIDVIRQRRATSGPRARSGPRRPTVRPATLLGNNIAIRPAKPQPKKMPVSWVTSCLLWWRSRSLDHRQFKAARASRYWLTRSTCSTAICFTFARFAGRVEEPWFPMCATCRRRSPPFFVRRIFLTLISSWPAMARSPRPADGHHYAPERPQREAAGQRHSRNRHARTHHCLRCR